MTQYNSLTVQLSNSQLNKLKFAIKNKTDVVLKLSSNMIGNSNDETNFPYKPLLTNRQVASLRKAFPNYTSTDIKLSKTQLLEDLPLMKNVVQPLAKSVLVPSGLAAAASAADAGIHKKS